MIKRVASIVTFVLLAIGLAGCAVFANKPLANPALQGRLKDNTYTSPRQTFRIRLPWLSTDATIGDEIASDNSLIVIIADDLCREFVVSQSTVALGAQSFESWVKAHIIDVLSWLNLRVESKSVMTRNGPAISLRYRLSAAAPCSRSEKVGGKEVAIKRDADVGEYVYYRAGVTYRLTYIVGIGAGVVPNLWYVNREPVDDVLAHFADGFEIMGTQNE
jgi:hypothetical protein